MKKSKLKQYLFFIVVLLMMFTMVRPAPVFAADGGEAEITADPGEIWEEINEETDIEDEEYTEEDLIALLAFMIKLVQLNQQLQDITDSLAEYNQLLMIYDMANSTDGNIEFVDKEMPLTNPVYEAGTLRWEGPGSEDRIYLVYYAYGYTDFTSTDVQVKEGFILPSHDGDYWGCDFHNVTNSIEGLNLGILAYKVVCIEYDSEQVWFDNPFSGSATVHVVMNPVYCTKDANDGIQENGGIIDLDHYMYFDGEPINVIVQENEGYKLSLLAHKKGTSTNFTLDSSDDLIYWITGEFTKVCKVTLDAGGEGEASSVASHFVHRASWEPIMEYSSGNLVTFFVPYGMTSETFYNQYLLPTTVDFLGNMRYVGVGAQTLDAYSSNAEIEADIANMPYAITEDTSYYLLWARPITSVDITVDLPASGTQVTSVTTDNKTTQDPAPKCTIEGQGEFGKSNQPLWCNANLEPFNGIFGQEACYLTTSVSPKFGYYFDESSYGNVRVNGTPASGVWQFYNVVLVIHDVSENIELQGSGETASAFSRSGGAGLTAAIGVAGIALGGGAGFLLGKKKKKA